MESLRALEEMRGVNATFPYTAPTQAWKAKGKGVIGWNCVYIPEELIHAAGMMPLRVTGDSQELQLDNANIYLFSSTCSYIRSCFELALGGQFDFLDAYISCSACEGVQRLGEVWDRYLKVPLLYTLDVPRKISERSNEFYRVELADVKQRIEDHFGVKITDEALWESIKLYDETRHLLKTLYELRKSDQPPISGAETMEVLNAAVRMPREEFNPLLRSLLDDLRASGRALSGRARVMVSGSVLNNTEFVAGVERLGALVVMDDVCTGARYWWEPMAEEPKGDPLKALANRYLGTGFPCPRMNPPTYRTQRILQVVKEWRIDGVIALAMRNCAPYVLDVPMWKPKLEEMDVPVLDLDMEYGAGVSGPARVRVEAFVEMLSMAAW
jgi:bzd-type benzoyl-CoA reductase N subunit